MRGPNSNEGRDTATVCIQVLGDFKEFYNFVIGLKVVGNEKVGGSGMCHSVPIWLGPRRLRFVSLSILNSFLILSISVSAPVMQND